jgi:hypothetical protein
MNMAPYARAITPHIPHPLSGLLSDWTRRDAAARKARALTVINDESGAGAYLGGWNIAPDGILIMARSYTAAWELLCEHLADRGTLAEADYPYTDDGDLDTDGCDWVDGHGLMVTADVVMRTVRPGTSD